MKGLHQTLTINILRLTMNRFVEHIYIYILDFLFVGAGCNDDWVIHIFYKKYLIVDMNINVSF